MDSISRIRSYVPYGDKCFLVSTIERDSSVAISPPPRFHETIAWEFDIADNKRGRMVAMIGDGLMWDQHFGMCRQLQETGEFVDDDN